MGAEKGITRNGKSMGGARRGGGGGLEMEIPRSVTKTEKE